MRNELEEQAVCGIGGCSVNPNAGPTNSDVVTKTDTISIEIISDAICPWCFVAKRRFEKAVSRLPEGLTVSVKWRPYELNPHMAIEGMDRKAYRSRKFGSWEQSQQMDAHVAAVGAQEGIAFHHELIDRTPNTFNAHRLIWLAEREGVQDAMVESIFRAYFVVGRDIGDSAVLAELAAEVGIDQTKAEIFLRSDEGANEVSESEIAAQRHGVSGVPTFVINGKPMFSGALRSEIMLGHMLEGVAVA